MQPEKMLGAWQSKQAPSPTRKKSACNIIFARKGSSDELAGTVPPTRADLHATWST